MIVIVDYDMGNLGSVAKALAFLGYKAQISSDPQVVKRADRLILPGVGAMSYAMARLRQYGLDQAIREYVQTMRPFLGICLGMQLMFEKSDEGNVKGLAILPGTVKRFPVKTGLKIPHMGWNQLEDSRSKLLPDKTSFYFVHSYYVEPVNKESIAAVSQHGIFFSAAVQYKQIFLTQFHPEKSGDAGLGLLESWMQD